MNKVFKKEITQLLANPVFYLIYIAFLVSWFYMFYRGVFVVGYSTLSTLFEYYPWFVLPLVGALTMGSFSKEHEQGTLELLLVKPVSVIKIVLAKIFSTSLVICFSLLFTIPVAYYFNKYGGIDFNGYLIRLLSAMLLTLFLVALGVLVSTFFNIQFGSLICFVFVAGIFLVSGMDFVSAKLPAGIGSLLDRFSLYSRYLSITRGVVDISDLIYFTVFFLCFIFAADLQIRKRLSAGAGLLLVFQLVLVLLSFALVGKTSGMLLYRFDLTSNKSFTLSPQTNQIIKSLNQKAAITLYVSSNLPSQYKIIEREVRYVLADYVRAGKGNIVLKVVDPGEKGSTLANQAEDDGVKITQFNVRSHEKIEIVTGYFGMAIAYNGQKQAVSFISTPDGFEYAVTSLLNQLEAPAKKTVAFVYGHGEKDVDSDYATLKALLLQNYFVTSVNGDDISLKPDILVLAGPIEPLDKKTTDVLKEFVEKGKSVLFLIENFKVDNALGVVENKNSSAEFLGDYGVYINRDLVYDLTANELIGLSDGQNSFTVPYPFWPKTLIDSKSPLFKSSVKYVPLPWASSITYDSEKLSQFSYTAEPLLITTNNAYSDTADFNVSPSRTYEQKLQGKLIMGVSLEKSGDKLGTGRIVAIGDSELFTDKFFDRASDNLLFADDVFSWLGQDLSLASLQTKASTLNMFTFTNKYQPENLQNATYAYCVLVPLLIGFVIIVRRKLNGRVN